MWKNDGEKEKDKLRLSAKNVKCIMHIPLRNKHIIKIK